MTTATLFRFTTSTDTISTIASTEKIEFNTGTVPDSTGRLVKPSFRMVSDLNPHPNPNRALNKIQDSLLGVVEVVIAGYFVDHNNTLGPRNLYNWSIEEDINDTIASYIEEFIRQKNIHEYIRTDRQDFIQTFDKKRINYILNRNVIRLAKREEPILVERKKIDYNKEYRSILLNEGMENAKDYLNKNKDKISDNRKLSAVLKRINNG